MSLISLKPKHARRNLLVAIFIVILLVCLDALTASDSPLHYFILSAGAFWLAWFITNQTRRVVITEHSITSSIFQRKTTITYDQIQAIDTYYSWIYGGTFIRLTYTDGLNKTKKMRLSGDADFGELSVLINSRRFNFRD